MKYEATDVSPTACPWCNMVQNQATCTSGPPGTRPKEGDLSLCFDCCGRLIFTADGGLRKPTAEEDKVFDSEPLIAKMEKAWRDVQWLRKAAH